MSEKEEKILLPKLGESILGATIVQWFKKEGDEIALDEAICEVSTDKVNSEIPSPVKGVLKKIVADVDDEIQVGDVIAVVSVAAAEKGTFFSPAVLRMAKEHNISLGQLEKIPATGKEGRLTKEDIERFLQKGDISSQPEEGVEKTEMTRMRKAIAENMLHSLQKIPHASLVSPIDVTLLMDTIQKDKEAFYQEHGAKLTLTSYVIFAMAQGLAKYPLFNSKLEGDTIITKKEINIGIAVHVEGGVLVPVLRDCRNKDLPQIAKALFELAQKARNNKLQPEDLSSATITLSNFGMTKIPLGFPVIHYPETAIIGMGSIEKKPVVMNDDSIAVRKMVNLTLTFDHRIVDGIYSCDFFNTVKSSLELDDFS